MTIALVDYGAGNVRSAQKGFERVVAEAGRTDPVILTHDPDVVAKADRVVLPGDGAFPDCRRGIASIDGMDEALAGFVKSGKPFLGICVGMQLLASNGLEHEGADGFDWIPGTVRALDPERTDAEGFRLKVPHMGWNTLDLVNDHPVLAGIRLGEGGLHAYFLHSYVFDVADRRDLVATTSYGEPLTAIVARDNVVGAQFHPEKSQVLGLALLKNFVTWTP